MVDGFIPDLDKTREPLVEDLVNISKEFQKRGVKFIVMGGFAVNNSVYIRTTMDIDFLMPTER